MSICSEAISSFKKIKEKNALLDQEAKTYLVLAENISKSRLEKIEQLLKIYQIRKELRLEIKEAIPVEFEFVVKNAINPYAEALKEGDINDAGLIVERKDIKINLQEILTRDREAYKNAGCNIWANALPKDIKDLNLTNKQIEIIKARVELGEIPIVMPGRIAQIHGLMQVIQKLKPKCIVDGKEQKVRDTYHWDYFDVLIQTMNEIVDQRQVSIINLDAIANGEKGFEQLVNTINSLPAQPYIFTASVNQQNDDRTRSKSLDDQIKELALIQSENPGLAVFNQSIGENQALQNRFTERVRQQSNKTLNTLRPLDDNHRPDGCRSRFISLPPSENSGLPVSAWNSKYLQLGLYRFDAWEASDDGFRVSVRV